MALNGQPLFRTLLVTALCLALKASLVTAADDAAPADFSQSGHGFLKQFCSDCHSGDSPEGGFDIFTLGDTASLVQKRKLTERMLDAVRFGQMPPEGERKPTPEEVDRFLDTAQTILEFSDRTATPDPGRVTMRRLNRVEYANTVRELYGIDFNPAEDFPADDIGHGFDNIGDVLTISPVLMERYLSAAETISERIITPRPPAPLKRHQAARYLEPAGQGVPESRFRPLSTSDPESGIKSGPFFTNYKVPAGEYIFRTRVFTDAPEGTPVKVALLACSKVWVKDLASDEEAAQIFGAAAQGLRPFRILQIAEVTSRNRDRAQTIEVRFQTDEFLERMAVALVRPEHQEGEIVIHLDHLGLEGPLDTRPLFQQRLLQIAADRPEAEQTREILTQLARKAYRRPPTTDEVDRLVSLVDRVVAAGEPRDRGFQLAIQALLVSPKFLFRMELDEQPHSPERRPLDEFQLASRLSYFLWSSMPDEELLSLAERGELSRQLPQQVRRMLADDRSQSLVDQFALQWLQLQRIETISPDAALFPQFNEGLKRSMIQETRLFLGDVFRNDRSVLDLLGTDFTYVNQPLAQLYGIDLREHGIQPSGGDFRRRRRGFDETFYRIQVGDVPRGGLLTQASILTVTSNPTRTSPVKRGKWVLEQLMGTPPPPPPPNVPELKEQEELRGSLREMMEQHRANPACANCHASMDPIGFAFENFDAIGRYRYSDGEFPIDPAGVLPGGVEFSGPKELIQILKARREQFVRCLTEKLLTFALGRGLEYYDRPAVNRILQTMKEQDDRFSVLVTAIVESEPFRYRRGN